MRVSCSSASWRSAFLVRGLLSENRAEKAFFLRMGGFLVVYANRAERYA